MSKVVFASDQLPAHLDERSRQRLWLDLFTDHLCAADISFFPDAPFYSRSEFLKFGDIAVSQLDSNIQTAVRTQRHVEADSRGDYIIGTMLNGTSSLIRQDGREAIRGVGQAMLYTNAAPIAAQHDGPVAIRCVTVPRALLAERLPNFEDLAVKPLAASPALRHLERYLAIVIDSDIDADLVLKENISTHLIDLVALVLGARGDSAELATRRGLRAARLQDVIADIRGRFADPSFSPSELARHLGLSPRYVQELLQETGSSFTERVTELRLQKARKMLLDSRYNRSKISDIAYACGFNEVSYFNRCFRRRFGTSPRHYRRDVGEPM
ncbi:AraC family transcriptional regulator [Bradyrhizobium yuanmingense]|uniref:AraC family transcriptional regulator n=1 Tax=Bradyrhizobium yuanmingense TaxID=108015 RepID=UPI0023B9B62C|nr:AraC family transcriptional regulator [Bradyrhizobium yuanmingense]MDF0496613.1 AraC family transcriptional regulator [Bradyrhizobium yuanmingense]